MSKQTKNIRIKQWNINLDHDYMATKNKGMSFTSFKVFVKKEHPDLVEKHRIKSFLNKDLSPRKIVAWDSLVEECILLNII